MAILYKSGGEGDRHGGTFLPYSVGSRRGTPPPAFPPPFPSVSERPLLPLKACAGPPGHQAGPLWRLPVLPSGGGRHPGKNLSLLEPTSCFPKGIRALASGPRGAWWVVGGPVGSCVCDPNLICCRSGAKEAHGRRLSTCRERLLFSGRRGAGQRADGPEWRGGLLARGAPSQPCLPYRFRRARNFTLCCCLFQTPLEFHNCERRSLFFGGRPY